MHGHRLHVCRVRRRCGQQDSHREVSGDRIKDKLNEVSGDVSAIGRVAQTLLHDKQKTVFDDAECTKLDGLGVQPVIVKVNHIRDITVDNVRRPLSAMPSKSSPL